MPDGVIDIADIERAGNGHKTIDRHRAAAVPVANDGTRLNLIRRPRCDMPMESYTLTVSEDAEAGEMTAELYDIDGLIEATERVAYDDYGLSPEDTGREAPERTQKTTTDVTVLDIQLTRTDGAFAVRVLGDREEVLTERIADEDWGLVRNTD